MALRLPFALEIFGTSPGSSYMSLRLLPERCNSFTAASGSRTRRMTVPINAIRSKGDMEETGQNDVSDPSRKWCCLKLGADSVA